MFKLPQGATRTLVAVHGWSGTVLGLLLYAVICTGVAAVFAHEINDWASPLAHPETPIFAPGIDTTLERLSAGVDPEYREHVSIYEGAGGRAHFLFFRHDTDRAGKPAERGVDIAIDPATGEELARHEGWFDDIFANREASAVADFLVNLHVRLHIPDPYGLFVTGVLGVVMMVAAVSGLLIHRHLIKDLFTVRRRRDPVLERRDLHAVAGSWNLPFAFILAFTGSFFSFAASVGIPALAAVKFGGDQEAMLETLYGAARPENATPAAGASIAEMLDDARRRGALPYFVAIEHPGRQDATVAIHSDPRPDRLVSPSWLYDGATGTFLREQPPLGQQPSAGAQLVGLMYPLHVGNFLGAASRAVWFALGFTGAYVTLTGMLLWLRRRADNPAWQRFARGVYWVGYGLPLALICTPIAWFALRNFGLPPAGVQGWAFLFVATATGFAAVLVQDLARLRRGLLAATGVALLCLPLIRLATGGMGWTEALGNGVAAVPAVDLALFVSALACLWAQRDPVRSPRPAAEAGSRQPVRTI